MFLFIHLTQITHLESQLDTAAHDLRTAEEEKMHAHEQVLSLIRECNALEDQVLLSTFNYGLLIGIILISLRDAYVLWMYFFT